MHDELVEERIAVSVTTCNPIFEHQRQVVQRSAGRGMASGNLMIGSVNIGEFILKVVYMGMDQYLLIHINTIFRGMNIHLPAILMFTRGTRF